MAGYTDTSYRQLVKELAPRAIVFSEFTSSDALHFGSEKSRRQLSFAESEYPFIGQIFGKKPAHFVEAAKWIESIGAAGVDINMGCPAKKVVSSDHGSALLEQPELSEDIVRQTARAISIPLSVKMRVGVKDATGCVEFARRMEAAGAQLLTLHGRTAKQMYTGTADFEPIYAVKRAVSVPVIGNGDIASLADFKEKIGPLDGLMLGRATVGNPWLMAEIAAYLQGDAYTPPTTFTERLATIIRHAELSVQEKGEHRGMQDMRKFFAGYTRGLPGVREFRKKLVRVETLSGAKAILSELVAAVPESSAPLPVTAMIAGE